MKNRRNMRQDKALVDKALELITELNTKNSRYTRRDR
jgi:hypothetical protein